MKLVVVGGGTAGWLAASHLGSRFSKQIKNDELDLILIESPDIPTIGVGEGTVPALRQTLKLFGITETELVQECEATFKQGVDFRDWQAVGHRYFHPFDYPYISNPDLTQNWYNGELFSTFSESLSAQHNLIECGKAPKRIIDPEFEGLASYAYHFDAVKLGALLARNGQQRLGITRRFATVTDVTVGARGIENLVLDDGDILSPDFVVDCTGFGANLLSQLPNGQRFEDKSDVLLCDTALAVQLPIDSASDLPSATVATARTAGWIWDITLSSRRGVGYVYSSKHQTEKSARAELNSYIGTDSPKARKIDMPVGYRYHAWIKNCATIGLSQGFVEPLEATGLWAFDAASRMLAELLPLNPAGFDVAGEAFNVNMRKMWEQVMEFVKLHYVLSDRAEPFWQDNRSDETIPESLAEKLLKWKYRPVSSYDFPDKYTVFSMENYLYVLYGMGFKHADMLPWEPSIVSDSAMLVDRMAKQRRELLDGLPSHRQLIDQIRRSGLKSL
jgi:tryptophan halogenase